MISASLPGEALAQLGQLRHAFTGAPPPPGMTPEFLAPRPYRYPPRAARPRDPPPTPPTFPPLGGAYSRYLPHPAPYHQYLYRPTPTAPAPAPYPSRPRPTSGFVPPAPAPRSPPPPIPEPVEPERVSQAPAPHFCRGALIRLEDGTLRRVEDMRTEDFVSSAERCADLALTHCTLLKLDERGDRLALTLAYNENRSQVELESTIEHPFFVYGRGWASRCPERTLRRYGLRVRKLSVGDVCVSMMERRPAPRPAPPQTHPENLSVKEDARKRRWSAPDVCDDDHPPAKKR